MDAFPQHLDTGAVLLRPLCEQDLPAIVHQLSDERVAPWLAAVPQPFGPTEAAALLEHSRQPGEFLRILEVEGVQAGCICLGAGLWYWLDPAYHGRGLMRDVLTAALGAWFAQPAPPQVATCREDNAASRALLTRLGFAQASRPRRMFFHGSGHSESCLDYLMAPEQWHLLHPPEHRIGKLILRPARQKDAPTLAKMLPRAEPPWPTAAALTAFIETHRVRTPTVGLFTVMDETTRTVAMALLCPDSSPVLRYLSQDEADRHADALARTLSAGLPVA